jgi:hypothetical protein
VLEVFQEECPEEFAGMDVGMRKMVATREVMIARDDVEIRATYGRVMDVGRAVH